jgi:hypothetical protein
LCESGQLLVESLDLGPAEDLPDLASAGPGWYRIRVHAHGRNTNPDGTDGAGRRDAEREVAGRTGHGYTVEDLVGGFVAADEFS